MFKSRVALAATLSASYGIYNGFELCEHTPIPGREEYLDSEKYEIKVRDWNAPGNIKDYIARAQPHAARESGPAADRQPALSATSTTTEVIGFVKESADRDNAVAVADRARPAGAARVLVPFRRSARSDRRTRGGRSGRSRTW